MNMYTKFKVKVAVITTCKLPYTKTMFQYTIPFDIYFLDNL